MDSEAHANICINEITPTAVEKYIQGVFEFIGQTLGGDRAHHKESELHRNPCPQTLS